MKLRLAAPGAKLARKPAPAAFFTGAGAGAGAGADFGWRWRGAGADASVLLALALALALARASPTAPGNCDFLINFPIFSSKISKIL